MPELIELYKNPAYEEVIAIKSGSFKIPSSQNKDKIYKRKLTKELKALIIKSRESNKLFDGDLLIAIQVFGNSSYIKKVDIDNVCKFVLDALKGVVYLDDKIVTHIIGHKKIGSENGVWIGIKKVDTNIMYPPILPLLIKKEYLEEFINK